jgi:hypothetical protein
MDFSMSKVESGLNKFSGDQKRAAQKIKVMMSDPPILQVKQP